MCGVARSFDRKRLPLIFIHTSLIFVILALIIWIILHFIGNTLSAGADFSDGPPLYYLHNSYLT